MVQARTFFGFDFGAKYIGLAVGQTITFTATSLPTIRAKNGIPNWDTLNKLIEEWQPCGLIVGLALQLDNSHSLTSLAAKKFGQRLHGRYKLPVYFIEERLTTVAARSRLKEQYPTTYYQHDIDAMSAVIILESWLNSFSKEMTTYAPIPPPI